MCRNIRTLFNFDPPTTPLDDDGQGEPYATYGFAAQLAACTPLVMESIV